MSEKHSELRKKLRALACKTPPGIADWGHERSVRFKAAIKAARIAADHPMSVEWMLVSRIRELQAFHETEKA